MAVAVVSQPLTQKPEPQHETAVTIHVTSTEAGGSPLSGLDKYKDLIKPRVHLVKKMGKETAVKTGKLGTHRKDR